MDSREKIQKELEDVISSVYLHSNLNIRSNVYFQPPANVNMNYPAIIYKLTGSSNMNANNGVYVVGYNYQITYLSQNIDLKMVETIIKKFKTKLIRSYTFDGIYHYVFDDVLVV